MKTDGTDLTRLMSTTALHSTATETMDFATTFGWGIDQPWANVSRDGTSYLIMLFNTSDGPNRLLLGRISGGRPTPFTLGPTTSPIGWTLL